MANGHEEKVRGWVQVDIGIGNRLLPYELLIMDSTKEDLILGENFLKDFDAVISYRNMTVSLINDTIVADIDDKDAAVRFSAIDVINDYILPPRSETIINARCQSEFEGTGIIEQTGGECNYMIARIVCQPESGHTVCRILNPLNISVTIHRGAVIGRIEAVDMTEAILLEGKLCDDQLTNDKRDTIASVS